MVRKVEIRVREINTLLSCPYCDNRYHEKLDSLYMQL